MTAAYRLKGVGWLGVMVAVVLGFYLISLQVAAERKRLDDVNARIVSAERDIRALETEFDTRANLAQLEQWNGDTLALTAPVAGQFLPDEAALAALDVRAAPGEAQGATMTAALVVPSLPAVIAPTPAPTAVPSDIAIVRVAAVIPAARPAVRTPRLNAMIEAKHVEAARATAAVARVRPQAVAMLDRKLLSDSTLGDIVARAQSEAGRRR